MVLVVCRIWLLFGIVVCFWGFFGVERVRDVMGVEGLEGNELG